MTTMTTRMITMTTKAFTAEPRQSYRLSVDEDGIVRAWDDMARYYTTCHAMTNRMMAAARRKANAATCSYR